MLVLSWTDISISQLCQYSTATALTYSPPWQVRSWLQWRQSQTKPKPKSPTKSFPTKLGPVRPKPCLPWPRSNGRIGTKWNAIPQAGVIMCCHCRWENGENVLWVLFDVVFFSHDLSWRDVTPYLSTPCSEYGTTEYILPSCAEQTFFYFFSFNYTAWLDSETWSDWNDSLFASHRVIHFW